MNNDTYTPCTKCGRPMRYCKGDCCKQPKGCQCQEYGCKHNACIRQVNPECPYTAVIPSVVVESISNLKDLADCFAHVDDINTTFYIDDKHRIMLIWAGPVEMDWPSDIITPEQELQYILDNALGLRAQHLYLRGINPDTNHALITAFYYDKTGKPFYVGTFEEAAEE